ncbi:MAG TPA: chemotaxis protein CheX [Bryobacteraceae bacterium]|nr:chemotaxis protein CheX [Bryobacteraceae bacterium]
MSIDPREMILSRATPHYGVTALLGLTGDWTGSGQVSCEPALACAIAAQFMMSEYPEVNDEVLDAVAELANMIVGNVKTSLENDLGPMGLSTPVIISGPDFETRVIGSPSWIAVPFECAAGAMMVQLVLSPGRRHAVRIRPQPAAAAEKELAGVL